MKLNLRSVDLNLLPIFEAIIETGQYSLAAERLSMSQPAMSAAVQRLRATYDDPLFVRSAKGLQATPKALAIYQDIRIALDHVRGGLEQQQGFDPQTSERIFRVISGDYFEHVFLPTLIDHFEQKAPKTSIQVIPPHEEIERALRLGRADIYIDAFPFESDHILKREVMQEELVVVAQQNHPMLQGVSGERLSEREFYQCKHAVLPTVGNELPLAKLIGQERASKRVIGTQVGHISSLLAVVSESPLIATMPKWLASIYQERLNLATYQFPWDIAPIPVYMMWAKAYDNEPALLWLRQQLIALIQQQKQ